MEIIDKLNGYAGKYLVDALIALLVFVIGFRVISWIENRMKKEHKFSKLDATAKSFVVSFVTISLKVLVIIIALSIIGIPAASLVTIVGSCAVAIGLALQGGLSNIAGGLMILIFKPFKVDDFIEVNSLSGTVKSINMFYTTITSPDNKNIQLPNGNLSNSNIINYSANPNRRVDIDLTVDYSSDIDKVKKVINKVVNDEELVLHDEDIIIRLKEHASSSLVFALRVWAKKDDYWTVYYNLLENVKEAFDKNNISIPYDQLDVHIKNN